MFYAIDAYPMYEHAIHQAAPAGWNKAMDAASSKHPGAVIKRVADAGPHCVVRTQGDKGIAICDNATIVSFGMPKGRVRNASLQTDTDASLPRLSYAANAPTDTVVATQPQPLEIDNGVNRRWLANLLLTFGSGFLLVSLFLFVTAREPTPLRR